MKKAERTDKIRPVLETRLALVVSALVLLSVLVTSVFTYSRYSADHTRQTRTQTQQLLEQLAVSTEEYLQELRSLCYVPYYSGEVMRALAETPQTTAAQLEKRRLIEGYLQEVMTIPRDDILRVCIYADGLYYSGRAGKSGERSSDYSLEPWYQKALLARQVVTFYAGELEEYPSHTVVSAAAGLYSFSPAGELLGVIRVDANYNGIKAVCDLVDLGQDSCLCIVDEQGTLLYSCDKRAQKETSLNDMTDALLAGKTSGEDGRYLINTQPVEGTGWTIVSLRGKDVLMAGMRSTKNIIFLAAFAFSLLGIALTVLAVRSFLSPLQSTVSAMQAVEKGDLRVRASTTGNNEIAYLSSTFNHMLSQLEQMVEQEKESQRQIYEAQYLEQKARYQALCNQIRPHFLFNALNTISLLVKMEQKSEAVASIEDLSVLLRGIVNTDREIPLRNELKIAESYLRLQQRSHDQLLFSVQCPELLQQYVLPALILQPLIENAIIHGLENRRGNLEVRIRCEQRGAELLLCVWDNGVGMAPDALTQLQKQLCDPERYSAASGGVGLINIHERLRLRYGKAYGLQIQSQEYHGTTVTVRLPWRKESLIPC